MSCQHGNWPPCETCDEIDAQTKALEAEVAALRKCLKDVQWRILDTRETLMRESMVGGHRIYGCDEWSTPTVNLQRAADLIDDAMNGANYY